MVEFDVVDTAAEDGTEELPTLDVIAHAETTEVLVAVPEVILVMTGTQIETEAKAEVVKDWEVRISAVSVAPGQRETLP